MAPNLLSGRPVAVSENETLQILIGVATSILALSLLTWLAGCQCCRPAAPTWSANSPMDVARGQEVRTWKSELWKPRGSSFEVWRFELGSLE